MVLPVFFFGILSAPSPAAALSIEDRVIILERTMLTKQDFLLDRAEDKKRFPVSQSRRISWN